MSGCHMEDTLHDYVDGRLGSDDKQAIETHLAECEACTRSVASIRALLAHVDELPRQIEPERDLWAGIAERIESEKVVDGPFGEAEKKQRDSRHFGRAAMLIAASVFVMSAVVIYYAVFLAPPPMPGEGTQIVDPFRDPTAIPIVYREFTDVANNLAPDIEKLERDFEASRESLSPVTIAIVEGNLAEIDRLIEEARQELEKDKGNQIAGRYYAKLHQKKFDVLRNVTEKSQEL